MHTKKLLSLFLLLLTNYTYSFRVSPIILNFTPDKPSNTQTMTLINEKDVSLPVEVSVFTREIDSKGEETRVPSEDFLVFPQQLILKPKERRNIRFTWKGKSNLDQEKSYRFLVHQVPIKVQKKKKNQKNAKVAIDFFFNYMAAGFVTPVHAQPNLSVSKIIRVNKKKLKFILKNTGNTHAYLRDYEIYLESANLTGNLKKQRKLESESIQKVLAGINILANGSREIELTIPVKTISGEPRLKFSRRK